MFVVPKLYHQYRYLFDTILGDDTKQKISKSLPEVSRVMRVYWSMIKARNEVFCGTTEENEMRIEEGPVKDRQTQEEPDTSLSSSSASSSSSSSTSGLVNESAYEERVVHALDSIGRNADSITGILLDGETWIDVKGHSAKSAAKSIFGTSKLQSTTCIALIAMMCRWATSESRYGDWKAYLVASILLTWRDGDKSQERKLMLQDALIRFLDDGVAPKKPTATTTTGDSQVVVLVEEGNFIY